MNGFKRLIPPALILFVIVLIGAIGYTCLEGWSLFDSLYMLVITLFTVGFQEVHPLTDSGRWLTMFLIVSGVGTAIYAGGQVMEIIVEGEIFGYRRRRRMEKKIKEMKDHYIICGFGRVGHQVAQEFEVEKLSYVVIDSKRETAVELEQKGIPYIIGDITSDDNLEEAGIKNARGLIACADSDVANVYVTLSARALNPHLYIVARAGQRDTEKKLKMSGANRVMSPYFISGRRMAALATKPVASEFLDMVMLGEQLEFSLREIAIPERSFMVNKTLAETEIRTKTGATVLAMRKLDGTFNLQPQAVSKIEKGDILVVIGTHEQLGVLEHMIGRHA